jgi:hypothetical protein
MGHGAAAALPVVSGTGVLTDNGIPKVDVQKMPLLSPYQLGPFKLSHRYGSFLFTSVRMLRNLFHVVEVQLILRGWEA